MSALNKTSFKQKGQTNKQIIMHGSGVEKHKSRNHKDKNIPVLLLLTVQKYYSMYCISYIFLLKTKILNNCSLWEKEIENERIKER